MKRLLPFLALIFFFGCNTEKVEKLETQVKELDSLNAQQTQYVEDVTLMINDVYDNLETIRQKQGILSKVSHDVETGQVKKDAKSIINSINDGFTQINTVLDENQKKIDELEKKIRASRINNKGLNKLVAQLKKTIVKREMEIDSLKTVISGLNITIEGLETRVAEQTVKIVEQTEKLNTAHYIIAPEDSLFAYGIAHRRGGFVGIGRKLILKKDFTLKKFTKVDISKFNELNIPRAKDDFEILTSHASNSYQLKSSDKATKLTITNPDQFWVKSKVLVIVED